MNMQPGIYLIPPNRKLEEWRTRARESGYRIWRFDGSTWGSIDDWLDAMCDRLDFPTRNRSPDSAIDWLGDLSWLSMPAGACIEANGVDVLPARDAETLMLVFARAYDRQRSSGRNFCIAIGTRRFPQFRGILETINAEHRRLSQVASLNDVREVPVFELAEESGGKP